ncbi:hypothetical protein IB277_04105 [Ensifer sp. ENS07]|uniref:GDSL-type esterase/lipase family protein n=1 Tax=Ensifer sp. ENS07 TaxID=2769274 RepID=UPI00177C18CB|nr:GDSL-type esterase/lipase family protein [Ensifer sp. ENS07]MBD9635485.1 hypothetical protein [Ensifer sp. ENS07]
MNANMRKNATRLLATICVAWSFCGNASAEDSTLPVERSDTRALARHDKLKTALRTIRDPDVLLIGDSIAQQWRKSDAAKAFGTRLIFNLGVGGDKTENVIWRMNNMPLNEIAPKFVIILAGTNNLGAGDTPNDIAAGVEEIARKSRQAWPGAHIRVVNLLPRGEQYRFREADREEVNRELAASSAVIGYRFVETDDNALTCQWKQPCLNYSPDRLHLSPEGYNLLAKQITASP